MEVKNLNSIRNVKTAIEFEAVRLTELLEKGAVIQQQTRSFDATKGTTFSIRDKEDAEDYRYFPEPDLTPFALTDDFIDSIRKTLPVLQTQRVEKYISSYQLSEYDSRALTEEKEFSDYFEQLLASSPKSGAGPGVKPKSAANWMLGPVKTWLNEKNKSIDEFPIKPVRLSQLIKLVEENKLSFSVGSSRVFSALVDEPAADPETIAAKMDLVMDSDSDAILPIAEAVLLQFGDKVKEYKKGKKGLLALFVGEVIKRSKGKADPKIVNEILIQKLNN